MRTKLTISIVVATMLFALAGCGELSKVNKALENNDIATVAEYYGSLKEEDKSAVADKVRIYCQNLSTSYTDDQLDYETVKADFDMLATEVMNGDEAFNNMTESIEILHNSREAYKLAEDLYATQEYEKALDEYAKVVTSDKSYNVAQDRIEECKALVLPEITGKWASTVDLGYAFASIMGMASDDRFSLEITQIYEFNADGTGKRYADEEKLKDTMEGFMSLLVDVLIEQYEQMGISRSQLDKLFKQQYGMSMDQYIRSQIDIEDSLSGMGTTEEDFTYTIDGDRVSVICNDNEFSFLREGDELLLDQIIDEATAKQLSDIHVELPMHFSKID